MVIDARQEFLNRAADALAASPSTSSHLLSIHTQLLHENSKALSTMQKKGYCGGCGSPRKPQWTKVTDVKPKRDKASKTSAPSMSTATVYKCLRCHERTVLQLKKKTSLRNPRPSAAKLSSQGPNVDANEPHASLDSSKSVDNQNSKKRAKARKQGGLQALMASKKSSQPSLDLFDFLQ
ncbi:uncharacterized protein N7511_002216 [Penicillium nucicola]|uniref:uncharacterized protein n=1 Tax=Penicillium nucicola TaxID=1850975 RepID=UPI0025459956|nr:uncharacterized protein N7511_002216 [Penicillium nucicola]KAJ5770165.1 hypothetical protein N7511_002216 [Penicillium nucicola]